MVLRGLQSLLERLYDVDPPYDVDDFLVTDRREVAGAEPQNDRRAPDESCCWRKRRTRRVSRCT